MWIDNSVVIANRGNRAISRPWRRIWHLCGGSFFPILAFFIPSETLLIALGAVTATFLCWEATRFAFPGQTKRIFPHIKVLIKETEKEQLTGSTYLLLSSLLVFLLFPKYIAVCSLLFLSLGDPVAGIVGEKFGTKKLFHKSLQGSFACLVTCLLVCVMMTKVSPITMLPVAAVGAVVATLVELLPLPIDDNFTIPLFSAGTMTLTVMCLG